MPPSFWPTVFRVKGAWNCLGGVGLLLTDDAIRRAFGAPAADPTYRALFVALAFVFGLGYLRVGANPAANREIVRMGILGQAAVFLISLHAVTLGEPPLPWPYLAAGVIDLVFMVLYACYLGPTHLIREPS